MRVRGGLSILVLLAFGVSCAGRSTGECASGTCSQVAGGTGGGGGDTGGTGVAGSGGTEGSGAAAGAGGSGVAGTGGASPAAGRGNVAGTGGASPAAGRGNVAGTGGASPAGGSGNIAGEAGSAAVDCSLPPESGSCSAAFQRWYYSQSGVCEPFIYGGCGATSNNFETEEACLAACQGQAMNDITTCASPSECVVIDRSCCSCAASSRDSLVAVNAARGGERCAAVDCLPCLPVSDPNRAWFGATCTDGHCRLFDARQSPITECTEPTDCTPRWGLACCESCAPLATGPVAVNLSAGFSALVCGDEPAGCDDCVVPDTAPYVPWCNDGRCEVEAIVN